MIKDALINPAKYIVAELIVSAFFFCNYSGPVYDMPGI